MIINLLNLTRQNRAKSAKTEYLNYKNNNHSKKISIDIPEKNMKFNHIKGLNSLKHKSPKLMKISNDNRTKQKNNVSNKKMNFLQKVKLPKLNYKENDLSSNRNYFPNLTYNNYYNKELDGNILLKNYKKNDSRIRIFGNKINESEINLNNNNNLNILLKENKYDNISEIKEEKNYIKEEKIITEIEEQIENKDEENKINEESQSLKKNSNSLFLSLSKKLELDPYINQIIKGKKITFKIGTIIYEGSTSILYKALNLNNGEIFCVKRYINRNNLDLFYNEKNILEQISNDNIMKYYGSDINIEDNQYFLYSKLYSNGNLKELIENFGFLPEKIIKKYTIQILKTLKYLHKEKKIIHRDIKCRNILIENDKVYLCDFGSAIKFSENNNEIKGIKGTLLYSAPEVLSGKLYNFKSDIWSLGCSIIEMGGIEPWNNKIDNTYQFIHFVCNNDFTPDIPSYFSQDLKNFLILCFQRNADLRPDASSLLEHKFIKGDN